MQLLVIDRDSHRQERAVIAGLEAGFFATGTGSLCVAEEVLTRLPIDVLLADAETMEDALGDLLGLAEERNTDVRPVLFSTDVAGDLGALSEPFPSLAAVLDPRLDPALALRLGMPAPSGLKVQEASEAPLVTAPVWRRRTTKELDVAASVRRTQREHLLFVCVAR